MDRQKSLYLVIYNFLLLVFELYFKLKLFQETISGAGAEIGSLDFLRNNPQVGFCSINCYALNARKHLCSAYPCCRKQF